jgi:hypothetical protein
VKVGQRLGDLVVLSIDVSYYVHQPLLKLACRLHTATGEYYDSAAQSFSQHDFDTEPYCAEKAGDESSASLMKE